MLLSGGMLAQTTGPLEPVFSADEVASPYVYVFFAAYLVAFLFTPIMRSVATYYGIIDQPDHARKMHTTPVAYLGGVAVFLGWMAGLAMSQFLRLHRADPGLSPHVIIPFSIVIGACVIVVLGLWDDIKKIPPWSKILGQVLAALFLLGEGIGTDCTAPLLSPLGQRIQVWFYGGVLPQQFFPQWFVIVTSGILVTVLVVGCCNAANLMDGLDGLCGGVTAIIAGGFLFLAVHVAMYSGGPHANNDALRVVLGMALLGAVLAFVPYNFNPASIFMGDTGSMFLGFACATMIILLAREQPRWFLASMVMFALPILDSTLALARRYVNKRPIFSADRHHFHHQLVARGLTVRKTVLVIYVLAIGFVVLGALIVYLRTRYAVAAYLVIFGSIIVAAYKMGMVHERPRVVTRVTLGADASGGNGAPAADAVPDVEPAQVLEVTDDAPVIDVSDASGGGAQPPPGAPVGGAIEEQA